ncbi:hypothetical protein V5F40_22865 [Xanthobacter sp. DSM 14520]|uniref:hypothetical protein n=1 Tax=Xanthobacter autotrophicus (strain ATCC BAA-1158 / Py2) TaxID=78245 RepID=UPI00372A391F
MTNKPCPSDHWNDGTDTCADCGAFLNETTPGDTFTVVENAGYEGENDRRSFDAFDDAVKWRDRWYSRQERERLHVEIRLDLADGTSTYEI